MKISKEVKVTRLASGDKEYGRVQFAHENLAPLVDPKKKYHAVLEITEV